MSRALRTRLGRLLAGGPAGILAGGLAACMGGAVDPPYIGTFNPATMNYMAAKGTVYTQVVGNPFAAPQKEVDRTVTGTMYGAHFGPNLRFSTKRDPDNTSPYRVVVAFDPGPNLTPAGLCKNSHRSAAATTAATATGTDTVRVMLALCASSYRESSVTGRVSGVTDPKDAAFKALIRQMTGQLFPRRNPNLDDGRSDFDI